MACSPFGALDSARRPTALFPHGASRLLSPVGDHGAGSAQPGSWVLSGIIGAAASCAAGAVECLW